MHPAGRVPETSARRCPAWAGSAGPVRLAAACRLAAVEPRPASRPGSSYPRAAVEGADWTEAGQLPSQPSRRGRWQAMRARARARRPPYASHQPPFRRQLRACDACDAKFAWLRAAEKLGFAINADMFG